MSVITDQATTGPRTTQDQSGPLASTPCVQCGTAVTVYPPEDGNDCRATCGRCAHSPMAVISDQTNQALAARCRKLADEQVSDPLARRAALCCGVVLTTTRTTRAARESLEGVRPDDVRDAAVELFDRITRPAGDPGVRQ